MKKLAVVLLIAALCGCQSPTPAAFPAEDAAIFETKVAPLIAFVQQNAPSGHVYSMFKFPSRGIILIHPDLLVRKSRTSLGIDTTLIASTVVFKLAVPGQADQRQPTILLNREKFSLDNPRDRGTLVHELTHFAQIASMMIAQADGTYESLKYRMGWECLASLEREAYEVQNKWLAANGASYMVTFPAHIDEVSRCNSESGPAINVLTNAIDISQFAR